MKDKIFDNNYNSNIGKAFRKLDEKFAEYFSEPSDELFGMMVTPISDYIVAYYWENKTAQQVFDIIVKILYNYDLICYNEKTKEYKTYMDKSIITRLNKIKKLINMATTTLKDKIYNIFKENELSYDYSINGNNVEIEVYWGDWKHDHLRLKKIMSNNGFMCIREHITDSDEDCYDAEYTFTPMYSIEYDS